MQDAAYIKFLLWMQQHLEIQYYQACLDLDSSACLLLAIAIAGWLLFPASIRKYTVEQHFSNRYVVIYI